MVLFFIKGGYPILLTLEVVQIVYMHIFFNIESMPFIQLKFLEALKFFHFTFFPTLFTSNYVDYIYDSFIQDVSFLANSSPIIFLWTITFILYILTTLLSNRKILQNKTIRKAAKKIKKYRLRYQLLHDIFWITSIYGLFFAMYQFRVMNFNSTMDGVNVLFAMSILVVYSGFIFYVIRLGFKYRKLKVDEIPRRMLFIIPEAS